MSAGHVQINTVMDPEEVDKIDIYAELLFRKGFIPRPSRYWFARFSMLQVMDTIEKMVEPEEEKEERPRSRSKPNIEEETEDNIIEEEIEEEEIGEVEHGSDFETFDRETDEVEPETKKTTSKGRRRGRRRRRDAIV